MNPQITPETISRAKLKVEKIKEDEADKPIIQTILAVDNLKHEKERELEEIERKRTLKEEEFKKVINIQLGIIDEDGLNKAESFLSKENHRNKFSWPTKFAFGGWVVWYLFVAIGSGIFSPPIGFGLFLLGILSTPACGLFLKKKIEENGPKTEFQIFAEKKEKEFQLEIEKVKDETIAIAKRVLFSGVKKIEGWCDGQGPSYKENRFRLFSEKESFEIKFFADSSANIIIRHKGKEEFFGEKGLTELCNAAIVELPTGHPLGGKRLFN